MNCTWPVWYCCRRASTANGTDLVSRMSRNMAGSGKACRVAEAGALTDWNVAVAAGGLGSLLHQQRSRDVGAGGW